MSFKLLNLVFGFACMALLSVAGCGEKQDPVETGNGGDLTDIPSYAAQIQPLLDTHCTGCHASTLAGPARNGAPAPVDLDSYEDAKANAERSNARILAGTMPPGGGVTLSERDTFQAWFDGGTQP